MNKLKTNLISKKPRCARPIQLENAIKNCLFAHGESELIANSDFYEATTCLLFLIKEGIKHYFGK